jgi:FkbM family methyltransferase
MIIPIRYKNVAPYLASFIHRRYPRPKIKEMIYWLTMPSKEKRAKKYIEKLENDDHFYSLKFNVCSNTFYYPKEASWTDLCQTIDECFNSKNWHHFQSEHTPIGPEDIVIDCGAAEGLFSFYAAKKARMVYAIEPIPSWQRSLKKTFLQFENIEFINKGVGHKPAFMRMTNDEIYSRISQTGDIEVEITTIDDLFMNSKNPISFIKADIEGYEFKMLLGAENVIKKYKPKISLTVYHDTNHPSEMIDFLIGIHPDYKFHMRGIAANGNPVILQAY